MEAYPTCLIIVRFFIHSPRNVRLKGLIYKTAAERRYLRNECRRDRKRLDARLKQNRKGADLHTHNLQKNWLRLRGWSKLEIMPEDPPELLVFSTFCIHWIGRYPVPLYMKVRLHASLETSRRFIRPLLP